MKKEIQKNKTRQRRKVRARALIHGTQERPRISVHKSNKHVYIQCIDDEAQRTLVQTSSLSEKGGAAAALAKKAAQMLKEKGVSSGVFDRGQYRYHGVVRTIAEEMRKNGITI
jgi:large subunit ribosomal protein L18